MKRLRIYIFCFSLLFSTSSFAGLQVFVWKPAHSQAKVLVPSFSEDNPALILRKYFEALMKSPDYTNAIDFEKFPDASNSFIEKFSEDFSSNTLHIAVQTNRTGQFFGEDLKRETALTSHMEAGADPYLIPIGLDLIHTPEQQIQWNHWIAEHFKALILLGGADLDPSLYHAVNIHSVHTSLRRDLVERNTVETFLEFSRGIVIGYCRGAQLLAALKGNLLIQDIATYLPQNKVIHRIENTHQEKALDRAWHRIHWNGHDSIFENSFQTQEHVNSAHHQGLLHITRESGLIVTARADDGIVEAFESTEGRIFGFQFHPEDMKTNFSRLLLKRLVQKAKDQSCLRLLSSALIK